MEKLENLVISDYYKELPDYKKIAFRNEVTKALEITNSGFYQKLRKNRWKSMEISAISSIIAQGNYA